MHSKTKALLLASALLLVAGLLSGAYLRFQPVSLSQPDGTKLDLFASGDEYYNWLHDKDGYTVRQNDSGWYVYLRARANGELIYTDYIVGRDDPSKVDLTPWANISPQKMGEIRKQATLQLREIGSGRAPTSGTLNNISIFIRFSDQTEFGQTISTYSSMFNGSSGNTMQSYFLEASYTALNISTSFYPTPTTYVVSWQDSHPRGYYSPYSSSNTIGYSNDSQRTDREFTLLVNAVNGVSSQIPTSLALDGDNDGMVDNVCFIIKGTTDGWAELLWPHRWSIYDRYVYINGKRVYDFNFQLSDFLSSSGVGVLCHEMFHSLGAPDLYHYSYDGFVPVGPWDIMENDANPPQHMGAYMKYQYGHWISSIPVISVSGTYTLNPLTSATGQCYRINSPNSSSEYFVVEFRKDAGTFESSLPGSGMLIYRINPAYEGNADGPPDEVYVFRPGGTPSANGTVNSANFSTQTGRTSFNNTTNPYGFLTDGTLAGVSLSSISSSAGSTMTFYCSLGNEPLNLTGESSGGVVNLAWQAPATGTPSSYKVYRNSAYLGTTTSLNYTDSAVTVGATYNYYVTAVYTSPAFESQPSNTVSVTVNSWVSVEIGTGTSSNGTSAACPINIYYDSLHGQAVYKASELTAAGITGPVNITRIGFYVTNAPSEALPNFVIRMKHTTATNVSSWQTATDMVTVYSSSSYTPTAGGYDMLTLTTPFTWNGTNNIVIDTAFSPVTQWSTSGTTRYTATTNGYRYVRADGTDQTNIFTGGSTSNNRPNVRLTYEVQVDAPEITVDPLSLTFGAVEVGSTGVQQFTIQNSGTAALTGTVTTPTGYSVAEATTRQAPSQAVKSDPSLGLANGESRNTLSFNIAAGVTKTYNLTFAPTAVTTYNGNVVITSNDADEATVNIAVTGSGYIPPTITVNYTTLDASLATNAQGSDSFTITNTGSQSLTFALAESPTVTWFSAAPVSGTIAGGGYRPITGYFYATGLAPGTYNTTLNVNTNDPDTPQLPIAVTLTVNNALPTIELPATFAFDMYSNLAVNFDPYVNDNDGQTLTLGYSGNTNILVSIDGLNVTFSAVPGWHGSENISFSVFDGYAYAYDTVAVTVNFVNTPPTIALPEAFAFDMYETLALDFSSYIGDIDVQSLTLGYSGNTNVLVSIDGLNVTFSAVPGWHGSEDISFSVFDGYAYAYDTVTVTVNFVNTPPTIELPESFSFDMYETLDLDFSPYVEDIDEQSLTLGYSGNTNSLVSIDGLNVTFSAVPGWHGSENISFSVFDGYAYAYDTVAVTVNFVNTPPTIALPEAFTFDMYETLALDLSSYIGDIDVQSLTLGYSGNTNVLVSIDGLNVTFSAVTGWHGSEDISFSVFDGYAYAYDTVTVTVNFVNTPPSIDIPSSFAFDMNGNLMVDFSSYVQDIDAQDLTLDYSGNSNILVSIDGWMVTFSAVEDWHGSEDITFSVFDGYAYAYDTVSVTVNFVNTPPTIALPDDFEFAMNGTLAVDFSAYVDDLDGDQLTLSVSGNDNIDVEINGLLVTFSATPDWYGSESLAFTVSDGYTTDSDTVEVSVYLNFLAVPAITSINQSAGGITLQWNAVPNATAYRIYRSFDPYGEFSDLRATVYTTSFEDNEVHPMAFYKVIAVNEPLTK